MNKIEFWTPVSYEINKDKSIVKSIGEFVDDYFYLGGAKAVVILSDSESDIETVRISESESSILETAVKVATYFSLFLPILAFLVKVAFRYTHQFQLIEKNELPSSLLQTPFSIPNSEEKVKTSSPALPLRGFLNGGNTCFMAAALQVLRRLPIVRKHIDDEKPLQIADNESQETLEIRQKFKNYIKKLINTSDQINKVSAAEIQKLYQLYANFKKSKDQCEIIIGSGGDAFDFLCYVIDVVLNIPEENYLYGFNLVSEPSEAEALAYYEKNEDLANYIISFKHPPKFIVGHREKNNEKQFSLSDNIQITPQLDGAIYQYDLAAVMVSTGSHAFTYLKNSNSQGWLKVDDGNVDKMDAIHDSEKKYLTKVFYTLVE